MTLPEDMQKKVDDLISDLQYNRIEPDNPTRHFRINKKRQKALYALFEEADRVARVSEVRSWLPSAEHWSNNENIHGPLQMFLNRIAELQSPSKESNN